MVEDMDQVRNFTQANRSSIVNVIYIVAAFVLVYYVMVYYFFGEEKNLILLKNKMATTDAMNKQYTIATKDESTYRVGSEFTLSFWIYISNYNQGSNVQSILSMFDAGSITNNAVQSMLFVGLHPTMPQLIVRAGNMDNVEKVDPLVSYSTKTTTTTALQPSVAGCPALPPTVTTSSSDFTWNGNSTGAIPTGSLTPCDIMDVDTQRWLNITVSVNNRIMDVYMDGKLARSCILPNIIKTSTSEQVLKLFPTGNAFTGYISGVQVSNYAVTPDVIYGRYQAGPYASSGFLDYLVDKLGIRVSYTGSGNETSKSISESLGIKL